MRMNLAYILYLKFIYSCICKSGYIHGMMDYRILSDIGHFISLLYDIVYVMVSVLLFFRFFQYLQGFYDVYRKYESRKIDISALAVLH